MYALLWKTALSSPAGALPARSLSIRPVDMGAHKRADFEDMRPSMHAHGNGGGEGKLAEREVRRAGRTLRRAQERYVTHDREPLFRKR